MSSPANLRLRLPATSANLGSGFDTAAVALSIALEIDASAAADFSITASGRDADRCSRLQDNLILETYKRTLKANGRPLVPLALRLVNEIPLGMGCGSSASAIVAAVLLAAHFGALHWSPVRILEEACALEGHPDNAAACWLGGFVATACEGMKVHAARVAPPSAWRAIVVLPQTPLATSEARALLPASYARSDTIANIQAAALLGLAFAQGRGDLLRVAMKDSIHQPYRASICPLLAPLLPLAGSQGILGVALSGSGPAVLVVVEDEDHLQHASARIRDAVSDFAEPELLVCRFQNIGACESLAVHAS